MGFDIVELKFSGLANEVAESEFSASFTEDRDNNAIETLFAEFCQDGSPSDKRRWLRKRLPELFSCVDERPQWIESRPIWPFHNGQPMTFIRQISVPENDVTKSRVSSNVNLYMFGTRVDTEDGWVMEYRVIEQHPDLP